MPSGGDQPFLSSDFSRDIGRSLCWPDYSSEAVAIRTSKMPWNGFVQGPSLDVLKGRQVVTVVSARRRCLRRHFNGATSNRTSLVVRMSLWTERLAE